MVVALLLWVYITVVTYGAGRIVVALVGRLVPADSGREPEFPLICLLGTGFLTTLTGYAWLFINIGAWCHALVVGLVLICNLFIGIGGFRISFWSVRQFRAFPMLLLVAYAGISFFVILCRTVLAPRLRDTGGYHAPMIYWMEQYSIVPGLANLNYQFGFNNSTFLLNALFSFSFLGGLSFHVLNGWFMLMLSWLSVIGFQRLLTKGFRLSDFFVAGLGFLFLLIFHWMLSSPTPDLPAHGYLGLCFLFLIRKAELDRLWVWDRMAFFLLILAATALTAKLSTLVVLLIPAILVIQALQNWNFQPVLIALGIGLMLVAYWCIGNVVLTGYLLYPSLNPLVDWWMVDWKVPAYKLQQATDNVISGTRGRVTNSVLDFQWLPSWFRSKPITEKALLVAMAMLPGVLFVLTRTVRLFASRVLGWGLSLGIATIGIVFWFMVAPDVRFGMGYISSFLLLGYAPVFVFLLQSRRLKWIALFSLNGILFCLLLTVFSRQCPPILLPADYPSSPLQVYRVKGHRVTYPTDNKKIVHGIVGYWGSCYRAPLPCSPYVNLRLSFRGEALDAGFRSK